jgi:DNA-binding NtrC family response regulator
VRELAHVLERAVLLGETEQIGMRDIASGIGINAPSIRGTLDEEVANFKRRCIIAALSACDGNRRVAAQNLGISPATLFRYLNEFGLAHYYPGPDETAATLNKESL